MEKNHLIIFTIIIALSYTETTFAQSPVKKVLLEEYTTASCGNCPPKSALVNEWHLAHQNNSVLVTIHQGSGVDAMSNATTNAIFNAMHSSKAWFAPAITINRGLYPWLDSVPYLSVYNSFDINSNPGIDSVATRLMNEPAQVGVSMSGIFDPATRKINATVNTKFVENVGAGDWRISLFLIEDSVVGYPGLGPFKGWDQHCYDASWANTNYPGMYDGTSIIGFPHRHVMRDALLGTWGIKAVIPSTPVVGNLYTTSVNWTIDTAYKLNHLKLVAFVSKYGPTKSEKYVLNAEEVDLTPTFVAGTNNFSEISAVDGFDDIYPIPTHGKINIAYHLANAGSAQISMTEILGHNLFISNLANINEGKQLISCDVANLASGIYFLTLTTKSGVQTKKIIIE